MRDSHPCCTLGVVGLHRSSTKFVVNPERGISLSGNEEDKQVTSQDDSQTGPDNSLSPHEAVPRSKSKVWAVLAGGIGGAVIVGAVWGIVAHGHQNDPLVASVGTNQIHQSNFESMMESMAGQQTLQQMITDQLIKDGAKAANITATKQDLATALQNLESQYGITSSSQLNQFLQSNGVTKAQLNDILTVNILEQKLAEQGITVTNTEIQNYYNQNKSSFIPQGSKTPEPLSAVKTQIVDQIKQSKAIPSAQLIANLAKKDKVTIYDTKYASIKTQLENPAPASLGTPSTGAPSSTTTNGTAP